MSGWKEWFPGFPSKFWCYHQNFSFTNRALCLIYCQNFHQLHVITFLRLNQKWKKVAWVVKDLLRIQFLNSVCSNSWRQSSSSPSIEWIRAQLVLRIVIFPLHTSSCPFSKYTPCRHIVRKKKRCQIWIIKWEVLFKIPTRNFFSRSIAKSLYSFW